MSFQEELRQILLPQYTDGKGVVYSKRLDQALTSIINLVDKEVIGETDDILRRKTFAETQTEIKARDNLRAEQRAKLKGVSNG